MTEKTLTLGDTTLRATVTGTGPTVLLLHAGGEHRGVWAPTATRLAEAGLRTVAYDLRGHGESTGQPTALRALADDVIEMVRQEPAPLVVVGASAGGYAALAALAEPTIARRVTGLILVDAVPNSEPERVRAWLSERGLLDQYAELTEDILSSGPELHTAATASNLPILLVRAGRSPIDGADFDRFRAANRRITLTVLPEAGHLVAQEAPAELARIVSAHAHSETGACGRPPTRVWTAPTRRIRPSSTTMSWPPHPAGKSAAGLAGEPPTPPRGAALPATATWMPY
ncbi:alpha/beta fold hydrolase [Nocardia sp. NPDC059177]|uniref:alpha/beta fold hydrolase n=1 Tax=Nocardia sp. NPDC059177 TaxID=3346759 RepID=UPI0036C02377